MFDAGKLSQDLNRKIVALGAFGLLAASLVSSPASADEQQGVNGGLNGSAYATGAGNSAAAYNNVGVGINGDTNGSLVNNNQTNVTTGSNQNQNSNVVNPIILTPTQSASSGGSSALILPRNPLPLPNAALGRSNFGMQVGVQNNPGLGAMGGSDSLGWFAQAGLTIPFGKIPDVYSNPQNNKLDNMRQEEMQRERLVFGRPAVPTSSQQRVETNVQGRIPANNVQNAYNFTTLPSGKLKLPDTINGGIGDLRVQQPKVMALAEAVVYTKPLFGGKQVGTVTVGDVYPYIGHTRSGWVNIVLPNGMEGWTTTKFEYIKNDFTEIDSLAVDTGATQKRADAQPAQKRGVTAKGVQ